MRDEHYEDPEDLTQVRNIITQLNEKPSQEKKREVVTRSDGSKVIRVTKRRKRMLTATDKQRKSRKSFIMSVLVFFLIACVFVGVFFWRMTMMGSDDFMQEKKEELRAIWGATELTMEGASLNGHVLHVDVIEASFPDSSMIQRVRMTNVEAELGSTSFLTNRLQSELVKIDSMDMVLNASKKHLQIPQAQQEAFWMFTRIECKNFSLSCGDSASSPVAIRNTKAYMYYPRKGTTTSVVILNDGTLHLKGWQGVRINDAKVTISSAAVEDFIIQGTTNTEENPAEELRTAIAFYGKIMEGGELAGPYLMDSVNINLADFTDARFDHFFTGRTKATLRGRVHAKAQVVLPFEKATPVFSGEMQLSNVCLTSFPVLGRMIEHIEPGKRRSYMPVRMNRAIVKITHTEDGIMLEIPNGGLVERDLINVHGNMKVDVANNLSGKMDYALPSVLTRVEYPDGISDPLFREMGEWAWLTSELRGRANNPDDNSADLDALAAEARKSRPTRVPFSQIDLERLMEDLNKSEESLKDSPLEIGPANKKDNRNPFESSDNPFAH